MFGFGPRLNTVFASRWKALWWSVGILMTAYCTVPAAQEAGEAAQKKVVASGPHHSPWDKSS